MIKQYFKQALAQLRQQPLLTTISVLGTALTICLIMVVVMQQQIKTVPFLLRRVTVTGYCMSNR